MDKILKERIDRELSPSRQRTKDNYAWKKNKWSGYASGYDTGARSSNEAPTWSGTKRSLAAPASPEGIAKAARYHWTNQESKMRRQTVEMCPKYFTYFAGELHFYAKDVLRGLSCDTEPYAPRLQIGMDGRLKYEFVTSYNFKWLKKTNGVNQCQKKPALDSN